MPLPILITETFLGNLADIESFLAASGYSIYYDHLIDRLYGALIPTLQGYPEIGRLLIKRRGVYPNRVPAFLGTVREYILDPYIVLYNISSNSIDLLYLFHQRQSLRFPEM